MADANWSNRTIWTGDNLDIMRGMNSESVDLIYLDPPFNSNADYAAPIGSQAAGAEFKDTWGLDEVNIAWHGLIKSDYPALYDLLKAVQQVHSDSMMSYLIYMAVRIMEMRRLLKPTGSIYLHCDPTAGHYLKLLMDAVFGQKMFRSEVVWRRSNAHSKTTRQFGPIHDTLHFYTKTNRFHLKQGTRPYTNAYIVDRFKKTDERGRYQTNYLTGSGTRTGESGTEWRGFDPTKANRHWAIPRSLRKFLPNEGDGMSSHEKLECLLDQGLIVFPAKPGGQPMYKQYIGDGVPYQDVWAYQPNTKGVLYNSGDHIDQDVKWLENEPEKTGYPTQKPIGLLRRIIESSSKKGDIVLDPFCGCATACVAAEDLGRQWIGIDISPKAADLVVARLLSELTINFRGAHRTDVPQRTDMGRVPKYNSPENKKFLYGEQGGFCLGCQTHFQMQHLAVDHIVPVSKGGTDHISNLQLLCNSCKSIKGNSTQAELLVRLTQKGYIKGDS